MLNLPRGLKNAGRIGILCVLLAAVLPVVGGGVSAARMSAALYNQANALYRSGDYAGAVARYETLLAQGGRNSAVYYNLGNAYYKAGVIGKAILSYERALRLAPGDGDVEANLRFVEAQRVDKEPEAEENAVTRFAAGIYRALSAGGLAVFCSACLFLASAVGIAWLFVPRRKVLWIGALLLLGLGASSSGALLGFKIHDRVGVQAAVVLAEEVVGRSGPGQDYLQVFTLHAGTRVAIKRQEGNWLLIQLSTGPGGWLPAKAVERI